MCNKYTYQADILWFLGPRHQNLFCCKLQRTVTPPTQHPRAFAAIPVRHIIYVDLC